MLDLAKEWAQIAPAFTPLVALAALLLAWRQLVLNRINQRETTAKATFREYLKLAVQYPELSSTNFRELKDNDLERYEWFVGYFLWSADELLELESLESEWGRNLQILADYHGEYFKTSPPFITKELDTYSPKTRILIKRAIASCGDGPEVNV